MLHPEMYSVGFIDLYKSLKEKYCINDNLAIAMDAGYITPYICKTLFDDYLEETNHLRHDRCVNSVYKCRKETTEKVLADAKEKHSMRYTHLRGLAKMKMTVTLTFACMNLKKMASYVFRCRIHECFLQMLIFI
ncbi:hypothetical protein FC764_10275 [Clostridium botulinum]|nr:hypothetical protein [Clostridium botulinum]